MGEPVRPTAPELTTVEKRRLCCPSAGRFEANHRDEMKFPGARDHGRAIWAKPNHVAMTAIVAISSPSAECDGGGVGDDKRLHCANQSDRSDWFGRTCRGGSRVADPGAA